MVQLSSACEERDGCIDSKMGTWHLWLGEDRDSTQQISTPETKTIIYPGNLHTPRPPSRIHLYICNKKRMEI